MKHFYDKVSGMGNHAVSCASITDSKGELCGKVLIRFTNAQIGWNHEVGVLFSPLDLSQSSKSGTYSVPGTLYFMFREAGIKCYDWHKNQIGDYENKTDTNYDSLSTFNDIRYIKQGRKTYTLNWII